MGVQSLICTLTFAIRNLVTADMGIALRVPPAFVRCCVAISPMRGLHSFSRRSPLGETMSFVLTAWIYPAPELLPD